MAQSAKTDHADFLALCDAPVAHGRVRRDSRAQERRGPGEIEIGRDAQHEMLVHDDAVGIAAVGDPSEMLVGGVEGERHVRAEVLKARLALGQVRSESTRQPTAARSPACTW